MSYNVNELALKLSIIKWFLVNKDYNIGDRKSIINCGCCISTLPKQIKNISIIFDKNCSTCPIRAYTNSVNCRTTPLYADELCINEQNKAELTFLIEVLSVQKYYTYKKLTSIQNKNLKLLYYRYLKCDIFKNYTYLNIKRIDVETFIKLIRDNL